MRRKSILPETSDKRSKDLEERVEKFFLFRSYGGTPPDLAVHVMHELIAGARAERAVAVLVLYSSPLPLLQVQRDTDLVSDDSWERWADENLVSPGDAEEFLRYCSEEPALESVPAFRRAVVLFVQDS